MSKTILLTSSGFKRIKSEIIKILPKAPSQLKLAHIITASKAEKNIDYLFKDKEILKNMGFQFEDIDIEGKNKKELKEQLKDKDIIYVQGGNTFYLLQSAKQSGFDILVKDFINQGKIYIGVSAGSYIACPTIEQATWKHQDRNRFGLKNLKALNLVPFLLTAHLKEEYKPIVKKGAQKTKYPVVALYDTQAVLVKDNKYKIVGTGEKVFFNGFKENLP